MTAHRCAYCGVLANMEVVYSSSTRQIFSQKNRSRVALACDNCEELMVVVGETDADLGSTYSLDDEIEILSRYGLWLPHSSISYDFEHVPPRIARAAEEAHQAADAKANMAAVLMARTTVEATAKDKGIIRGTLFEKIDRLRDDGHIRRTIAQAAHQIRHLGNDMAHGDLEDGPSEEDTRDVLTLMDTLLREVYEAAAITSKIIERRNG
ncbi:DUF4145 domain-containing protein [Curtobacterium sp. AB451]|uniref:DUF4145 domain-containing protein n=1 Tax=Curtobacterium sp. AB451 TaxID=3422306 RepID=UPI003D33103B